MKKALFLSIFLIIVLLLSACSNDYKESMENGTKALEAENFESALASFEKALQEKPDDPKARNDLNMTKDMYFEDLVAKGTLASEEKNFKNATEMLKKAYEFNATKNTELPNLIAKNEALQKKQDELNAYAAWLTGASEANYNILKEWRSLSDGLSIGTVSKADFLNKLKGMLTKSNELLVMGEEEILNISGDLSIAHGNYLREIQLNHSAIHSTILKAQQKESEPGDILSQGNRMSNIHLQQGTHIQALRTYAQGEGIVFSEK